MGHVTNKFVRARIFCVVVCQVAYADDRLDRKFMYASILCVVNADRTDRVVLYNVTIN